MAVLEQLIENHFGTEACKEEEAYKNDIPSGLFIEKPII